MHSQAEPGNERNRLVLFFIVTPAKAGVQALNNKTGFLLSQE
jgi:hypothetical protein